MFFIFFVFSCNSVIVQPVIERPNPTNNVAPLATSIETTITGFGNGASNFSGITNGIKGPGTTEWNPTNANERRLIFKWANNTYTAIKFEYHNTDASSQRSLVNGSRVQFILNGAVQNTITLTSEASDEVSSQRIEFGVNFNEVVIIFSRDEQNLREIEIYAVPFALTKITDNSLIPPRVQTNIAPLASLSATAFNYLGNSNSNLAAITNGLTGSPVEWNPVNTTLDANAAAHTNNLTFTWSNVYTNGSFRYYNHTDNASFQSNINSSRVQFFLNEVVKANFLLQHTAGQAVITNSIDPNVRFNKVVLTFLNTNVNNVITSINTNIIPLITNTVTNIITNTVSQIKIVTTNIFNIPAFARTNFTITTMTSNFIITNTRNGLDSVTTNAVEVVTTNKSIVSNDTTSSNHVVTNTTNITGNPNLREIEILGVIEAF